jgi:hypothetical protein
LKNRPIKPAKNQQFHLQWNGHLWYNIAKSRGMKNAENKKGRIQVAERIQPITFKIIFRAKRVTSSRR